MASHEANCAAEIRRLISLPARARFRNSKERRNHLAYDRRNSRAACCLSGQRDGNRTLSCFALAKAPWGTGGGWLDRPGAHDPNLT